jgi:arylsulfatase A-like enzyme
MADHFDHFEEVLTKARWMGMVKREATAEDLNKVALEWFEEQIEGDTSRTVFLWVHYVEPHAPYVLQRDFMNQIGASPDDNNYSDSNKYDTEIAYVDFQISELLEAVEDLAPMENTMVLFVSDHGESLGEHGYWGHGRHLYEPTLHIPMGITWPGHIESKVVEAPALIIDLAPTVVGLLGIEVPHFFQGMDWSEVFAGAASEPHDRVTLYQAHRGSVGAKEDQTKVREKGLLEVARLEGGKKEILRVTNGRRRLFDLRSDPGELENTVSEQSGISEGLQIWLDRVEAGLILADELPPPSLSDEDMDALRALGYLE